MFEKKIQFIRLQYENIIACFNFLKEIKIENEIYNVTYI